MQTIGRAEYENTNNEELFEEYLFKVYYEDEAFIGEKATKYVYPWAYDAKNGIGMIIGEKGCGKTFFAKKLAQDLGAELYILDKDNIEYKPLNNNDSSTIIVDDLHYFLQIHRLGKLTDNPIYTDKEILEIIKDFYKQSEHKKVVFISDDGISGLYHSFDDKEMQKEFLKIFSNCIVSPDDAKIFYNFFDLSIDIQEDSYSAYMSSILI